MRPLRMFALIACAIFLAVFAPAAAQSDGAEAFTLERAGTTLHYWIAGPADAPAAVFTHGAGMDHRMFDAQVEAIAGAYRTIVWDVRAHGLSQPIGDGFSIRIAADDLLAILDAAEIERAVLVGQSMGSYISQELIYHHPERALALVSIGGTPLIGSYSFGDILALRASAAAIDLLDYTTFRQLAADTASIVPEVRAYAFEATGQIKREDFRAVMGAIADALRGEEGYRLPVPALIVHGDQDNLGTIKPMTPGWAERDAGGVYHVIPDAGHNANQDNPDAFNALLLDFLAAAAPVAAEED